MTLRTIASLLAWAVICSYAQTTAPPSFEVASIKPTASSDPARSGRMTGGPGTSNPGEFTASGFPLRMLITRAYDLQYDDSNLVLGPPSLDRDKYDIVAKVPLGAKADQLTAMLRSLLAERFGLVAHWEQRELPSYDLVVAKGGSKLREAEKAPVNAPPDPSLHPTPGYQWPTDKNGWPVFPPGFPRINLYGQRGNPLLHIAARMQTVADLLRIIRSQIDHPAADKTGLTGTYDFTLDCARAATAFDLTSNPESSSGQASALDGVSDPAPDIFAALESQLGLKLISSKSSVKVLVVDKVGDKPTEN